jgi:Cys-tRNA(Pro)/Cys-tRNA(Cys) deacylase
MAKTNAARMLDSAGVRYEIREYQVDENDLSAPHVAEPSACRRSRYSHPGGARRPVGRLMACIPANTELDLKASRRRAATRRSSWSP